VYRRFGRTWCLYIVSVKEYLEDIGNNFFETYPEDGNSRIFRNVLLCAKLHGVARRNVSMSVVTTVANTNHIEPLY
jgi:hypothetical protein